MNNSDTNSNSRRKFLRNAIGTVSASMLVPGTMLANETEAGNSMASGDLMPQTAKVHGPVASGVEANLNLAKLWWPEQKNVWTPIGWKNHYFRFNVLYNGDVIADPNGSWLSPRKNAVPFVGKDFLVSVRPSKSGKAVPLPRERISVWKLDGGVGIQGWNEAHETPVLYTDFPLQDGLVIRKEIFAHVKGGKDPDSSIDPLFAWMRISVIYVDEQRHPDQYPVCIQLSKNYYDHHDHFEYAVAVDINPAVAAYPAKLSESALSKGVAKGIQIKEPDGKLRLAAFSSKGHDFSFNEVQQGVFSIITQLKAKVGDAVNLLLPILPVSETELNSELDLGYDAALAESDRFWAYRPATAARVHVPEKHISKVITQSLKFAEIIAEKDYKTNEYTALSGSWGYDNLWTTPTSMVSHMFLDMLGYHEATGRYLQLFRKNQGSVKPPGPAYELHPGYYSTPKNLTAIDWLTDHGAVLHQAATHALLTADKVFIEEWTDSIVKACDFIKDMCGKTNHDGVKGLLPPGVATDEEIPMQALWNLVWNYKGLTTAVTLLQKIKHARAQEFETFAATFKKTFTEAYTTLTKKGQYWTDDEGRKRFKPPTVMSDKPQPYHIFSDAFYLDTGPMALVWAGLMDADHEFMKDTVAFFRNGPNQKLWPPVPHALWRPFLIHEISTCEPCYSWNVFHSWQLNNREKFLEGMYSLYMGALSQNTYISCEHRHGIQGNLFATPLAFYLTRLAVIDEHIVTGELHILRLCPLAWIVENEETVFEKMPTNYGPVSVYFKKSVDKATLVLKLETQFALHQPKRIVIHIPPASGLKQVSVNGKKYGVGQPIVLLKS